MALKGRSQNAALAADAALPKPTLVKKGDIVVSVVETGTIDANKVVELKGRVTGRLAKLFVDEGDSVTAGQLIAVIDPKETQLRVEQDAAQLRGAESAVGRTAIEIAQRKITAQAAYEQAQARVRQLSLELRAEPTVMRAAIQEAQNTLNTAMAERDRLQQSAQPNQRNELKSAVDEAQANYDNANQEYRRQADLSDKGYVAGRVVDSAKLVLDLAKVRLQAAKDNLAHLESAQRAEMSKATESIEQARAALRRAQANAYTPETKRQEYLSAVAEMAKAKAALKDPAMLEKQRDQSQATVAQLRSVLSDSNRQLNETEIRAPISGIVTKKLLQVGELATGLSTFSSGSTIVKIEDRSSMKVKLDINEIDMAKLKVGMAADIDVDAIPNHVYHGVVTKIAPASKEPATGQASADAVVKYEVEINLRDADAKLRSGMSAKCTVDVIRKNNVLVVPIDHVIREGRKSFVEITPANPKAKGAKPERREIKTGAQTGALVEIVSGLVEGDQISKPKYNGPQRKGFMSAGPDEQ
ncbi:RND family efflux transporter MFP subunit [Fimbriimonas ginsengisoli Gsoil 348]|uniref:RND family efflux transporter MFP subunit n=2 Tax=Fimbriimonas ginsengisoli TaxID=1005039 RepID=A0A068NVJ1_FIMGI|nr:RND family efflux transporter MFP subunit [Fimbriimonas ginsengisoli Gsoil 348]